MLQWKAKIKIARALVSNARSILYHFISLLLLWPLKIHNVTINRNYFPKFLISQNEKV